MYSIQETARITGFSPYTLRYYERQQVLPPVARDSAGNRDYSQEDIHLLEIIRCLKNTGMPVNDIGKFISLCQKGDGTLQQRLQVLLDHKCHVQQKIAQMEGELEHIEKKIRYYEKACQAGTEQFPQTGCYDVGRCACAGGCGGNQ